MRRRDDERMTRAGYYALGCEGDNHTIEPKELSYLKIAKISLFPH